MSKNEWNKTWIKFCEDNVDVGNDLVALFQRAIKHFNKNELKLLKQASDESYERWIDYLFRYFEEDEMNKGIREYNEAMDLLEDYLNDKD